MQPEFLQSFSEPLGVSFAHFRNSSERERERVEKGERNSMYIHLCQPTENTRDSSRFRIFTACLVCILQEICIVTTTGYERSIRQAARVEEEQ